MLVAEGEFTLDAAPGVRLFPDDGAAQAFYALPEAPRLAVDDAGRPEVSLAAYGKRIDGVFKATGGVLTFTTLLDLPAEQRAALPKLLARRLEEAGVEAPKPQLMSPEWMEAQVDVHVADGVDLTASPSLSGDNRASFNAKLSAEQAQALLAAWKDGLPKATIRYRGRLRAAAGGSSAEYGSALHAFRSPEEVKVTGVSGFAVRAAAGAGEVEVEAAGAFAPPAADLGSGVQTVEL